MSSVGHRRRGRPQARWTDPRWVATAADRGLEEQLSGSEPLRQRATESRSCAKIAQSFVSSALGSWAGTRTPPRRTAIRGGQPQASVGRPPLSRPDGESDLTAPGSTSALALQAGGAGG
jgi:hypothetical protein